MSQRRKYRADRVAEQVADGFLAADLDRAMQDVPPCHRIVASFGRFTEDQLKEVVAPERIGVALSSIRADPQNMARLLAYLGDTARTTCPGCGRAVTRRASTGRVPSYCDNACRQRAYRNRKRLSHRNITPGAPSSDTSF